MNHNYGEVICKAVDEIVSAKINTLEFDITKSCTIIDTSNCLNGRYIVSDGAVRFEAHSTVTSYENGDRVLVSIPNGDYNLQKNIVSKIATDNKSINYVEPLKTVLKGTKNLCYNNPILQGQLLANNPDEKEILLTTISGEDFKLFGFNRIALSADFKTLLKGFDVIDGIYGLRIELDVQDNGKTSTYKFQLSSKDMLGNPYEFETFFNQQAIFEIPDNIDRIDEVKVYFFQGEDFKNGANELIPYQYEKNSNLPNNLYVDNIELYFGYNKTELNEESLIISSPNLSYDFEEQQKERTVDLRWFHKEGNEITILNEDVLDLDKFEVHWYRHVIDSTKTDEYGGVNWELVNESFNHFTYSFIPNKDKNNEQIKVVGLVKERLLKNDQSNITITPYFSNILVFENKKDAISDVIQSMVKGLSLRFLDGTEGNYFMYNQSGSLINSGQGSGFNRQVEILWHNESIKDTNIEDYIDYIAWYMPNNINKSMIYYEASGFNEVDKSGYFKIKMIKPDTSGDISTTLDYSIRNNWSLDRSNNTIKCVVSINGIEYETIEELQFGKRGTNGSNMTLVLEFLDNANALIATKDSSVRVGAFLYDADSRLISMDGKSLAWDWHPSQPDEEYMEIDRNSAENTDGIPKITIKSKIETVPTDNYYILKANCTYDNIILTAYLPIPIKTENCIGIEGAREIIYDYSGKANYYTGSYIAYLEDNNEPLYDGWAITISPETMNKPELRLTVKSKGAKGLVAPPLYTKESNDKVCVYYQKQSDDNENIIYWSQPLLIMQSQYDFAALNSWNGELQLKDNDGSIIGSMIAAGRKDDNNTFSGVLVGDITKSGVDETKTGVYGIHQGALSYGLLEDGTAFFGKYNKGRIILDGNESIIRSYGWEKDDATGQWSINTGLTNGNSQGTLIDLDNSTVLMQGATDQYFKFNNNGNGKIEIKTKNFSIDADGNSSIVGHIDATSGTFSGELKAATGTFAGTLSAAGGTFTGELQAAKGTFTGALSGATGDFTGKITASSGNIGGWEITGSALYARANTNLFLGNDDTFYMYSKGSSSSANIAGSGLKTDWRLGIGSNFGVDKSGNLYCAGGKFTGEVNATSGTIGGITISEGVLSGIGNANIGRIDMENLYYGGTKFVPKITTFVKTVKLIKSNYGRTINYIEKVESAGSILTGYTANSFTLANIAVEYSLSGIKVFAEDNSVNFSSTSDYISLFN